MTDSHHNLEQVKPQTRPTEYTLLATDDAMVWAEEFCRIFDGRFIGQESEPAAIGPGTMVGWFANAMQTAVNLYERKKMQERVTDDQKEAFMEGFNEGRPEEDG